MKNKITKIKTVLLGLMMLFGGYSVIAQTNVGVSVNYVSDNDVWSRPLEDLRVGNSSFNSNPAFKFEVFAQQNLKCFSPSLHFNLIYRSINYSENNLPLTNYDHFTLEIPLKLNFYLPINDCSQLMFNFGGGVQSFLTQKNIYYRMNTTDSTFYNIELNANTKPSMFLTTGIGINNNLKKSGSLQMKIDYKC